MLLIVVLLSGCGNAQAVYGPRACVVEAIKEAEAKAPEVEVTVVPEVVEEPTRDPEGETLELAPLPPKVPPPPVSVELLDHVMHLPLGPEKQADVPENLLGAIKIGYDRLSSMRLARKRCGGPGKDWKRCFGDYLIAAADAQGNVTVFSLYQEEKASHGFKVTCERKGGCEGGVNPSFYVESPPGWTVVAIRTAVRAKDGQTLGAVYIPYSFRLDTPELRMAGLNHLAKVALAADTDLRKRKTGSDFFPGKLVTDIGTPDHLITLALTEQMLHDRKFVNGSDATRLAMLNRTLTIIGANLDRSFWYARSRVGAAGIGQIMPATYRRLSERYDGAGLPSDREFGRLDHVQAFKAMSIHADSELWPLSDKYLQRIVDHPDEGRIFLAGGYNANAQRVYNAIKACKDDWRKSTCKELPSETRRYLIKYEWIYRVLFDPDFRQRVSQSASTRRASS